MKIEIPKIYEEIRLCEYAQEFGEQTIRVWVNPPRDIMVDVGGMREEIGEDIQKVSERFLQILADFWNWPVEDVKRLADQSQETDPMLFRWLSAKTFLMIKNHRLQVKKN